MKQKAIKMRKAFIHLMQEDSLTRLPVVGDGLSAKISEKLGFKALNVTGFAINSVLGKPNMGFADFYTLVTKAKEIIDNVEIPVICDVGTGHGLPANIERTVRNYETIGAAGIYIDDGVWPKKCGQMNTTLIVSAEEMIERIKAALSARKNSDFSIIAHSAIRDISDIDKTIERYQSYIKAGIDVLYVDKVTSITELRKIAKECDKVPLFVNANDLKRTIDWQKLSDIGYKMATLNNDCLYNRIRNEQKILTMLKGSSVVGKHSSEDKTDAENLADIVDTPKIVTIEEKYSK